MALKQGLPEVLKVAKTKPYLTYMPLRYSLPQDFELKLQEMEMDFQAKMPASECSDGENIEAKSKSIVEVITKAEVEELIRKEFDCKTRAEVIGALRKRVETKEFPTGANRFMMRKYVKMSDKAVADSVEALIGCFLLHGGQHKAIKVMHWLGIDVRMTKDDLPTSSVGDFNDFDQSFREARLETHTDAAHVAMAEKTIGYTFKEKSFLIEALTHASHYGNLVTQSYERLEYLGDGVLDFVISSNFI